MNIIEKIMNLWRHRGQKALPEAQMINSQNKNRKCILQINNNSQPTKLDMEIDNFLKAYSNIIENVDEAQPINTTKMAYDALVTMQGKEPTQEEYQNNDYMEQELLKRLYSEKKYNIQYQGTKERTVFYHIKSKGYEMPQFENMLRLYINCNNGNISELSNLILSCNQNPNFYMKFIRKLLFTIILIIIIICSIILLIGKNYYNKALKEKPLITKIDEVTGKENFVKFEDMSADYRNAVISVEDHRFYDHGPVDFIAIGRAIFTNVKNKELQEGGSTITQQVAKNIIFSQDKSWVRKVGEIFASYDLEKNYSKKEIFELYVNTAYFGDGYYGIYDASYGYYNKSPKDLNLDEASMLAGVPNAPSVYAPTVNPNLAKKRQYHVLNKMNEYGYITKEEALSIK